MQGGDTVLANTHPAFLLSRVVKSTGVGIDPSPCRRFDCAERAIMATFNPILDRWEHTLINIVLQAPFAEGSMQSSHYMIDLTEPESKGKLVLKLSRYPDGAGQVFIPNLCFLRSQGCSLF